MRGREGPLDLSRAQGAAARCVVEDRKNHDRVSGVHRRPYFPRTPAAPAAARASSVVAPAGRERGVTVWDGDRRVTDFVSCEL